MLQRIEHLRKLRTRCHKSIHLALEVKTFFGNFTPATGSSMKSSTQRVDFPLTTVIGIIGRERVREKLAHNSSSKA
jgi:hypothetical protein